MIILALLGLLVTAAVVVLAGLLWVAWWAVVVIFFAFTFVLGLAFGDPTLGFALAFPATGIALWLFGRSKEKAAEIDVP